jgi:hypothetical protein
MRTTRQKGNTATPSGGAPYIATVLRRFLKEKTFIMNIRLALSLISVAGLLTADTLVLKNGSTINGHFVGGDDHTVRFSTGSQVNTYDVMDIDTLRFSSHGSASNYGNGQYAPPPPVAPAPPPTNSGFPQAPPPPTGPPQDSLAYPPPAPTQSPNAGYTEVPAGTTVSVRLIDPVDSQSDRLGQTYRASIDRPVIVGGQTVIPRGADAVAVLSDEQKSGRIEGRTNLTIALRSVSVNGHTYDLATSNVNKSSGSRTTKSGEVIGGTAALGAIIGALAGGGRGAAIGAVSGAGVGTAAQVATHGERVKIPSETVLTFQLQNPLDLNN